MTLGLDCERLPHSPLVRSTVWTYFSDYQADAGTGERMFENVR